MSRRRMLAATAATFGLAGVLPGRAAAAQFELKCGGQNPLDHPLSVRSTQMWAAVERETGGRVHTQFFPNAQLGSPSATFSQLRLGAIDFLQIGPGDLAAVIPPADISYLGFAYKDVDEAFRVMDGPLGDYLRREAAAKNLHGFRSVWDSGMFQIGSNTHPIRNPADLRGFKIRLAESKISVDLFKTLGASPTPFSPTELYTALQTRAVDGEAAPLVAIETQRWFEVNKYVSVTNHAWSGLWMIANGPSWSRLPSDIQDVIERNNTKYAVMERKDTKLFNASVADKLVRQGLAFNQPAPEPFRALLRPYFEYWSTTFGPTAWGLLESSLGRKLT